MMAIISAGCGASTLPGILPGSSLPVRPGTPCCLLWRCSYYQKRERERSPSVCNSRYGRGTEVCKETITPGFRCPSVRPWYPRQARRLGKSCNVLRQPEEIISNLQKSWIKKWGIEIRNRESFSLYSYLVPGPLPDRCHEWLLTAGQSIKGPVLEWLSAMTQTMGGSIRVTV